METHQNVEHIDSLKTISFVHKSINCQKEEKKYYAKRNTLSFFNYCPTYNETNVKPEQVSTGYIRNILSSGDVSFKLSSTTLVNQLDECASHCRNIAYMYSTFNDLDCYCLKGLFNSISNFKTYRSDSNLSIYLPIYKTGSLPIKYLKPSFGGKNGSNKSVVVVYLLMLNGRDVISFSRLFRTIYSKKDYYFIHIDQRQKFLIQYLNDLNYNNVFMLDWSMSTIWGGTSLLMAYRRAMKDIVAKDLTWDFVINLSESDYLIRSKTDLDNFLSDNKEMNFVKTSGESILKFIEKQGLNKAFIECDEHLHLLEERQLPKNLIIDGGSDWFALSYKFVYYLVTSTDDLVDNLFNFFQNSLLPAETFFHTALQNSKFCHSVVNSNLRFTNWNRARGCRCQHSSVIGWCGCSPSVIRQQNYDMIKKFTKQDRTIFFARKFDAIVDAEILDTIDREVHKLPIICSKNPYSHIINFRSKYQDGNSFMSLTSLLFVTAVTDYVQNTSCFWKTVNTNDEISLFLAILHNRTVMPDIILHFRRDDIFFEAVLEYVGKAGTMSVLSHKIPSISSLRDHIQSVAVSQNYDVKENLFRTPPFLLRSTTPFTLELKLHSRSAIKFDLNVVFIDPHSVRYSFHLPNVTSKQNNRANQYFDGDSLTFVWFDGFDIPSPYRAGLWEVVLYSHGFQYPLLRNYFYVQPDLASILDDSTDRFLQWHLKKLCMRNNRGECSIPSGYKCKDCLFADTLDSFVIRTT